MNTKRISTPARVGGIRTRVLAVLVAAGLMTLTLGAAMASADSRDHRNAENTFTKWITGPGPAPIVASMAGVVGGDVGDGTFTGEVLTLVDNPAPPVGDGTRVINAAYHFNGSRHSFSALMHVVATGHLSGDTAVLTGVVTEGWLAGNLVSAEYTQGTCTHGGVTTTCFQGTLAILRGTKSGD
jgi:hypothetical protein